MKRHIYLISSILLTMIIGLNSCEEATTAISDTQKLAALRNVTVQFNGMEYEIGLPPGALSGTALADLLLGEDSSTYKNPENYSISIAANLTVDNTASDAEDAKFDGMEIDIVLDTIESNPINMYTPGFEVEKGKTYPVQMETTINLKTHKAAGLYIFRQTVDGNDLATTTYPYLHYTIGTQTGTIDIPSIYKEIPTRASEETKEFLSQLLDSGILEDN